MKYKTLLILLLLISVSKAQSVDDLDIGEIYLNEIYGTHERNKFDIILPKSKTPTGLVIYVHGGGFFKGKKENGYYRKQDIQYFINNNIAYATINYRFMKNNDSLGVYACIQDIKQALQYIRFNASKYNIDKARIGCYGSSAGAGSSLLLAFHNDMAIKGDTTLSGESTRIKCVGAIATQATYNIMAWKKYIPGLRLVYKLKKNEFNESIANFYGYPTYKSFKASNTNLVSELDMLAMINAGDPPTYLMNLMKETFPKNYNIIQHHRKHAIVVSKRLNKFKIENHLCINRGKVNKETDITYSIKEFLVDHIK